MAGHAVFINYRRDDAADACGRIYDRLVQEFTAKAVFKDVDALPVGHDFGVFITDTLRQCRVMLAVIGPHWLDVTNDAGQRRLDDANDWVRVEIETAHANGVQVVPVLLNGATLPSVSQLPTSLHFLPSLNAAIVRRDPDFHNDMDRLIAALKEGALTGLVEVEAPSFGPGAAAANWSLLKQSDDTADLRRFAESFPGTNESFEARRRADWLDAERQRRAREEHQTQKAAKEREHAERERLQAELTSIFSPVIAAADAIEPRVRTHLYTNADKEYAVFRTVYERATAQAEALLSRHHETEHIGSLRRKSTEWDDKCRRVLVALSEEAAKQNRQREEYQSQSNKTALAWVFGLLFFFSPIAVVAQGINDPRILGYIDSVGAGEDDVAGLYGFLLGWPWFGVLLLLPVISAIPDGKYKVYVFLLLVYWVGVAWVYTNAYA